MRVGAGATGGAATVAGLVAVTAAALIIRCYRLGQPSFWFDEGFSADMAEQASLAVWKQDVHPPLYYALLAVWRLASDSDGWLRLFSVLMGVATLPVVYGIGARLFGRAAGLWAAALLAVTHFHVKYSQETRMYALVVLLFAGALWGLVVGARQGRAIGWVAYTGAATLLLYSHGLAPVYVAALAAVFPLLARDRARWQTWRPWVLAHAVAAALFAPWLTTYLGRARAVAETFWLSPDRMGLPLLSAAAAMTVQPIPSPSAILQSQLGLPTGEVLGRWLWFAPVLGVAVWGAARARGDERRAVHAALVAYALPVLLIFVASVTIRPVLILRVLVPSVVPLVLLVGSAAAVSSPAPRRWGHAALAGVALILLLGTAYHFRSDVKEQWREASRYLQAHAGAEDVLLLDIDSWSPNDRSGRYLLGRYDPDGRLRRLRTVTVEEVTAACRGEVERCLDETLRAPAAGRTVWVVHSHARRRERVRAWLEERLERSVSLRLHGILVERALLRG